MIRGQTVLTVTQVNVFIKSLVEGDGRLAHCFLTGEISNLTDHYSSGHIYLSLKDERSVIRAVMFASAARRLKFRPKNGMRVLVRGRVSVYEPQGQYQFYIEDMQPEGAGARALALEQLKEKLQGEGLFDPERKRPIPSYPRRIAVITSPTGAAVQDILQITGRRWPLAEIDLYPVLVQGEGAPAQLRQALCHAGEDGRADVIILGRGGGSAEDLWAFNDEALTRAVAESPVPVVSAVGHETDFTLCDFAADLRAPTPSAAAELCTPDIREEAERVAAMAYLLRRSMEKRIEDGLQRLDTLTGTAAMHRPQMRLEQEAHRLARCTDRLYSAAGVRLQREQAKLGEAAARLDALSPLKVFSRGYAAVYNVNQKKDVASVQDAFPGDTLRIRVSDGTLRCVVEEQDG